MKIIYEQGDVVYNTNNYTYAIVIGEYEEIVKILELGSEDVFINSPPKSALKYCGHTTLKKHLHNILGNFMPEESENSK